MVVRHASAFFQRRTWPCSAHLRRSLFLSSRRGNRAQMLPSVPSLHRPSFPSPKQFIIHPSGQWSDPAFPRLQLQLYCVEGCVKPAHPNTSGGEGMEARNSRNFLHRLLLICPSGAVAYSQQEFPRSVLVLASIPGPYLISNYINTNLLRNYIT